MGGVPTSNLEMLTPDAPKSMFTPISGYCECNRYLLAFLVPDSDGLRADRGRPYWQCDGFRVEVPVITLIPFLT